MTVAAASSSGARDHCKTIMKSVLSIFRIGFNSSKCKTMAKMTMARIKLLRNKRQVVVKQMRRDIALLLQSGQDATARIRVEHVIREQNILAANEILEIFCELIVSRLSMISKRRECPEDLKEGISSLIFAAPRCSDIPELLTIRDIFQKKYGKDFVSAAIDLRPSCGVNRMLIDKLSVRTPTGEVKLKVMKEIAKEYQIEWDTTETETELLNPPEELTEGPRTFVSACSMPVKRAPQSAAPNMQMSRSMHGGERDSAQYENIASAAVAAEESAMKAIAAAQAAAYLANRNYNPSSNNHGFDSKFPDDKFSGHFRPNNHPDTFMDMDHESGVSKRMSESHSSERSNYTSNDDLARPNTIDVNKVQRRHTYSAPHTRADIEFDESDCDEEIEMEEPPPSGTYLPPDRPAPSLPSANGRRDSFPSTHPKLPDYDVLSARFEALKYTKSQK